MLFVDRFESYHPRLSRVAQRQSDCLLSSWLEVRILSLDLKKVKTMDKQRTHSDGCRCSLCLASEIIKAHGQADTKWPWDDEKFMPHKIFLVASNRSGGEIPSVVKSTEQIFWTKKEAVKHRDEMGELSEYFGVYRATIRVEKRVDEKC